MGKACVVCGCKPKYGINSNRTKILMCNLFDQTHVNFLKENNLVLLINKIIKLRRALGFVLLLLGLLDFIFFILGSGSGGINNSILLVLCFVFFIIGMLTIGYYQQILNKIRKSVDLSHPVPPNKKCDFCDHKSKIKMKKGDKEYQFCDDLDLVHLNFLRENNMFDQFQRKFNRDRNNGIWMVVISHICLILFIALVSSNIFLPTFSLSFLFSYIILLLTGIYYSRKNQKYLNRIQKILSSQNLNSSISSDLEQKKEIPIVNDVSNLDRGKFCPNCGFKSKKANIFCGRCGSKLLNG